MKTARKWASRTILFLLIIIAIAMIIGAIYLMKVGMIIDRKPLVEISNNYALENSITGAICWIGCPILIVVGVDLLIKVFKSK